MLCRLDLEDGHLWLWKINLAFSQPDIDNCTLKKLWNRSFLTHLKDWHFFYVPQTVQLTFLRQTKAISIFYQCSGRIPIGFNADPDLLIFLFLRVLFVHLDPDPNPTDQNQWGCGCITLHFMLIF
jgi:hypothetical protein